MSHIKMGTKWQERRVRTPPAVWKQFQTFGTQHGIPVGRVAWALGYTIARQVSPWVSLLQREGEKMDDINLIREAVAWAMSGVTLTSAQPRIRAGERLTAIDKDVIA